MKGKIFVISAPSGTGKTTIQRLLLKAMPSLKSVITCTTRKPRNGEKNGVDYKFLTEKDFEEKIKNGEFLEYANVYGNFYGTPKKEVIEKLSKGENVLLVIDTQGGMNVKRIFPDAVLIGILPPSIKEQEKRLRKRGDVSEEEIRKRLEAAKNERKTLLKYYNYRVINKEIGKTVEKIRKIVEKHLKRGLKNE